MIPDSFKQDLLNRVDVVDVVGRYVKLKKGGANYLGLCPFHGEKTPSFSVSPAKQFYHCFGCGAHGNAIGFLMAYGGMGYVDAVKDLAASVGMQVPEAQLRTPEEAARKEREPDLYAVMERAMEFYRAELRKSPRAIEYLKGRGLTGEIAARFRIGYAPDDWQGLKNAFEDYSSSSLVEAGLVIEGDGKRYDRFRDRVMFPILNARGAVIGFGGRVIGEGEPKYLNSPETPLFEKGREVYGLVQARDPIRHAGRVLVVEGYMDVVALAQFEVGYAVATLGTATSPVHVSKLLRLADEVVFCFDGDAAGRKAAWRALEVSLPLAPEHKPIRFLFLPEGEDPDSYVRRHGKDPFEAQIRQAETLSQFLMAQLRAECDLSNAEGRARLVSLARDQLEKAPASALKVQLVNEVGRMAGLSEEDTRRLLGPAPGQASRPTAPPVQRRLRTPPSTTEWKLLSRVAAYPALASDIDLGLMNGALAESRALGEIRRLVEAAPVSEALLIEHVQNTPHAGMIFEAQAHALELKETEDESREFVRHTLDRLQIARKIEELKRYEERLGRGLLSKDEHRQYARMISEVKALEMRLRAQTGPVPK
ncbi:MAG TPA: DNA primase [Burkholderiales bacterium]|nr:DNA primase [Burkholderiales bacterium]